jgi:hypothetical protein
MSFPSTASEQARLQAVNPDNMTGSNGYPKGCTLACHFAAQGACPQSGNPGHPPSAPQRIHRRGDIAKDLSLPAWERRRCPLHPATTPPTD